MAKSDQPRTSTQARRTGEGGITPLLPLFLFETMRDLDRPDEVLEGEDLAASLPRRFGLNDVVFTQIHRFREEVRRNRPQSEADVENLVRLVIRRPDADAIFEEAGRRLARRAWEQRSTALRRLVGVMPPALALRAARKALQRLFRQIVGRGELKIGRRQIAVRIRSSFTARADPGGAACALYAGAFAELMEQYTGRGHRAEHAACEGRGAAACEWTVLVRG